MWTHHVHSKEACGISLLEFGSDTCHSANTFVQGHCFKAPGLLATASSVRALSLSSSTRWTHSWMPLWLLEPTWVVTLNDWVRDNAIMGLSLSPCGEEKPGQLEACDLTRQLLAWPGWEQLAWVHRYKHTWVCSAFKR